MIKDVHARIIQRGLNRRGHEAVLWYGADLPDRQTLSLTIDSTGAPGLELRGAAIDSREPFDAVWLRRPAAAVLPESMHPGDRRFATREWTRLDEGLWRTIAPDAFWVNPYDSAQAAKSKSLQLREAARVGLPIPPTLFSNDPQRIREFIRSNPGGTIYKPFLTAQWRNDDEGTAFLFTATVDEDDLPDDEYLRLSPGIFQPRIEKSHELRVTFIGQHTLVARLDSQAVEAAQIDWRAGTRTIATTRGELPPAVEARCRALLARLGLVFACVDLIVTSSGEHVFIEVNQMGQFLWLEEIEPELPLVDAFCEMLIQGRPDFTWDPARARLHLADLEDHDDLAQVDALHVPTTFDHLLDDAWEQAS
ncbi:hypothetical protein ACNOYE_08675 [Nannocystaceae bacterium ST9]